MSGENWVIETFTDLAPRYEKTLDLELSKFWGWRYSDFVDHLIKVTPLVHDNLILDVATGTGVIPRKIKDLGVNGKPIHGLDITPAMLTKAQKINKTSNMPDIFRFTCASALAMPYRNCVFDVVLCGLATHHMDVRVMLSEIARVLQYGGQLSIADVGGHPFWNFPGFKLLLKIAAFVYFLTQENLKRAWAEAQAISNIRTPEEWQNLLVEQGFMIIQISRLDSKYFWIPKPLLIRASKITPGENNEINK